MSMMTSRVKSVPGKSGFLYSSTSTGRKSRWHGHDTSYGSTGIRSIASGQTSKFRSQNGGTSSQPHTYKLPSRASADPQLGKMIGFKPRGGLEPSVSSMGLAAVSETNDFSAAIRTGAAIPTQAWMDSKWYPDTPSSPLLQLLGFSTATNAPLGVYGLYQSVQATKKSAELGDKRGVLLGANDILTTASQAGLGVTWGGIRVASIGAMLHPASEQWAQAAQTIGLAGGITGSLLYGFATIGEILRHPGRLFGKSFSDKLASKNGKGEKIKYLKNRLGLDERKLAEKALTGKTDEEFRRAALEALRPMAEKNIQLLEKHQKVRTTCAMTADKVDQFVAKFLGKKQLTEHGKRVMIENLRAKKIQKMARELGGPEGLTAAVDAVLKPRAKDADVEKVVLGNIDAYKSARNKRIAVYAIGTIVMVLMCIFTGGIGAAVLAGVYALVALAEMAFSWQKLEALKKENSAPGRYDKIFPVLCMAIAVGGVVTAFVLANIFGFGLPALVIGIGIAALWIGTSIYHLHCIDKRRENYMETLLAKKQITIQELDYLREYLPEKKLLEGKLLEKLPREDRVAIQKHIKDPGLHGKNYREKLKEAIQVRYAELEVQFVKQFWGEKRNRNWLVPGMIALSNI